MSGRAMVGRRVAMASWSRARRNRQEFRKFSDEKEWRDKGVGIVEWR